jgi:hypothetical protein
VLASLLLVVIGTMTTSVRAIVLARQRTGATAVADEVMEQARGRAYAEVGHNFNTDTTLASDTALTGTSPSLLYNGELLAGSIINGANAPFSPHTWTSTRDGTPFTVTVYVTSITPALGTGDAYKRITIKVTWANAQFASTNSSANTVKLSSFLFPATQPPDPLLDGVSEADGGTGTLTGTMKNLDLADAHLWWPYGHGEIASHFIKIAKGSGDTLRAQVRLNSGALSGCTLSNGGLTADCFGVKADTFVDNDAGTSPPEYDAETTTDASQTISAGTPLSLAFGDGGSAKAESAARSSAPSTCTGITGNDLLPYHCSDVNGPGSLTLAYHAGSVQGNLVTASAAGKATSLLDRTNSGGQSRISVQSTTTKPALDLVTVQNGPVGFSGAVRLSSTSVTAAAAAGPGAAAPSVTGSSFTVQLWDNGAYRDVTVTPGTAYDTTASASMDVSSETITMTTTLHVGPKVATSTTDGSGVITSAEASLTNWLWVEIHVVVVKDDDHSSDGDFVLHVDYGRVSSKATYRPA